MSIGWPDLGGALLIIAVVLLIAIVLVGFVVWLERRRGTPHVLLSVAAAVARMWLALVIVGAVVVIWRWVAGGETWITGLPVTLTSPLLTCDDSGAHESATLVCASVPAIDGSITGLDGGTRAVLALGDLLGIIVAATPALAVAIICRSAMRGLPFAAATTRWLFISALVILVAGMGAGLVSDLGRALAAAEVLPAPGGGDLTTTGIYRLTVPLWPIGAAFALGALGIIFRHGARLQRETDLLV
ncbi:MAG: hypothetical protein J0I50_02580 [Microbacterium sp.]|uniref:hypothetical protein n=1 Tax=Microbacterium sp. TaxID=51671 RepID=UPI001ACBC671|nr:hypothetical protein [Microbacterium sp.]MBN9155585.1 hypothetical protein [Microbacterium sp.]MBN9170764.1 hypothetical protein [Microbacterium sp.]